jgi:glycosyltransferase involved in cell wall biosynthesis
MPPKIALFYDWINQWGGAERLLLDITKLYPKAPIYTLYHNPSQTPWAKGLDIRPSFLNRLPLSSLHPPPYTPLHYLALEQFDFNNFDILISLTSQSGHSILTRPQTLHLNYCLTPNRYLWLHPPFLLKPFLKPLKKLDQVLAQRPDYFLTTSRTVQKRIKTFFHRDSFLVYPGVNTSFFKPASKKDQNQPYYLLVSRLVAHKKADLVIKTFNQIPDRLFIVGSGRQERQLRSLANSNIRFLGSVSPQKLRQLYQHAQALICPQEEDFGFTPLEAMACGTPAIAYQKGGHLETISPKTGLFFSKQDPTCLKRALSQFKKQNFLSTDCRHQILRFSQKKFMLNFKSVIQKLWQNHQKAITI